LFPAFVDHLFPSNYPRTQEVYNVTGMVQGVW